LLNINTPHKNNNKFDETLDMRMNIRPHWTQKYNVLKDYIKKNPEIHIDTSEVSIPEHLRDEFYIHFDDVRNAVVEAHYGSLPLEVDALRRNYSQSEKEIVDLLGVERIELPVDLSSFLHNPKEGLVRGLFNRLFEMVQGKITVDDFERMAHSDLNAIAAELFRLGYEPWAALALIRLLDPDEVFGVELDEDYEPFVVDLKEIAFGRQFHHTTKRIPELILRSEKLDSHIAVKMPLAREVDTYYFPYKRPSRSKKRTGDTSHVLDSRVMFLSIVPELKKIPVFADFYACTIESPDLTVEFLTEQDLGNSDVVAQVQKRVDIMKPRLGGSIVVMNPEPESDIVKPMGNTDVFSVGLDPLKLYGVINKLT
jgi:hypothetical protein